MIKKLDFLISREDFLLRTVKDGVGDNIVPLDNEDELAEAIKLFN